MIRVSPASSLSVIYNIYIYIIYKIDKERWTGLHSWQMIDRPHVVCRDLSRVIYIFSSLSHDINIGTPQLSWVIYLYNDR